MENLKIQGSKGKYYVPSVNFDATTGKCDIWGESFLESTVEFYKPLINWLDDFANTKRPIVFNIKLEYYNTSSAKRILEILQTLKDYEKQGGDVVVNWHLEDDDYEIVEEIEDYIAVSKININIIIEENELVSS